MKLKEIMQIYHNIEKLNNTKNGGRALALGYFDGLHIGHRAVIKAMADWAQKNSAKSAVFSFELPSKNSIKGKKIISINDKIEHISAMNITEYYSPNFAEIKNLSPEQFVELLAQKLNVKAVFCGENFRFGKNASGDVALLKKLCNSKGILVFASPLMHYDRQAVSASKIRDLLQQGDIPAVNAMLGTPYCINFEVIKGQGLGTKLGVPTINQHYESDFQMPKFGIYITKAKIGGTWYASATGLGTRPTVNSDETIVTCETFIPNFEGDLYGSKPQVCFYKYLSESKKFNSLDELKACIEDAAKAAVDYFKN